MLPNLYKGIYLPMTSAIASSISTGKVTLTVTSLGDWRLSSLVTHEAERERDERVQSGRPLK